MVAQKEGASKTLMFDPNIQVPEIWYDDWEMGVEYTICIHRFVETINDRRNFNKDGYVRFTATLAEGTTFANGFAFTEERCRGVVVMIPYAAITLRWASDCVPSRRIQPMDDIVFTFMRTTKKRLRKLKIEILEKKSK